MRLSRINVLVIDDWAMARKKPNAATSGKSAKIEDPNPFDDSDLGWLCAFGIARVIRILFANHNPHYGIITRMAQPPSMDQFKAFSMQVLGRIENASTRGMYRKGLTDFLTWWGEQGDLPLDRTLVQAHVGHLVRSKYSSATINQRLAAIRKVAGDAAERSLLDLGTAAEVIRIGGIRRVPVWNKRSLDAEQTEALINAPEPSSTKGLRDRALLALLVGCALRRSEVVRVLVENIKRRNGRWVLIDVVGRRDRIRTVAVPQWTKIALDKWLQRANLQRGPIFPAVDRSGTLAEHAISAQGVLPIVVAYGRSIGLEVKPDDLRRTCARLCHAEGGELEQIQLLLGHASIQTTERYLGTKRKVAGAANDRLRMKWYDSKKLAS
jgi:site-specific recombinase XerD